VLADECQARGIGLLLQQGGEVGIAVPASDQPLDQLVDHCGDRHRHLVFLRGGQAKVEVLAQQRGGERRFEIEVHVRRRLVAGEQRTHHALVKAFEERLPADPALFR
jgi:hypothetical protein